MTSIPQALCLILNKAVASRRAVYSTMSSLKVMIWFRMTLLRKIYLSPLNPRLTTLTATRLTGQIVLAPSRFHSQWLCHAHNSSHQHGLDSIDQPGHLHRRPRRSLRKCSTTSLSLCVYYTMFARGLPKGFLRRGASAAAHLL